MSGRGRRMAWAPERIAAFWDYWSDRPDAFGEYFSCQVGGSVVAFLGEAVPLRGRRVLDLGCGPGFLIPPLLAAGAQVWAADGSAPAVARVNARHEENPLWRGASVTASGRVPLPDGSFDLVCCVETIEHLPREAVPSLIGEIRRLLAPGGRALLTTPDEEDLERSMIFCPECGAEFHKVQHITSWSVSSLATILEEAAFDVLFCRAVDLCRLGGEARRSLVRMSLADLGRRVSLATAELLDRAIPRPFPEGRKFRRLAAPGPHLVALAAKPGRP